MSELAFFVLQQHQVKFDVKQDTLLLSIQKKYIDVDGGCSMHYSYAHSDNGDSLSQSDTGIFL